MKIAIIGGGIAGLAAAHALRGSAHVTLYEAGGHFGGHANTVDMTLGGVTHGVDTGFLVFNQRTYPGLVRLFAELGVSTAPSEMSFSVQVPRAFGRHPLEWSGSSLDAVFCQRINLMRPRFWRMLRELLRFNALATGLAESEWDGMHLPLGAFLKAHGFSREFRDWYLLPMVSCIWSSPAAEILRYPVGALVRFCHNHGLLQVADRPQWYTVAGGSRRYVEKIVGSLPDARLNTPARHVLREDDGVLVATDEGTQRFDQVILANHPHQALEILPDATRQEQAVLGAIRYQPNRAVLHTDASVLPRNPRAWAAWNYESGAPGTGGKVCLHYLINRLQPLPWQQPVIVSLNPLRGIDPAQVHAQFDYEHPVFDGPALRAQAELPALQGRNGTWFCGAWAGNGFHEDGLVSGQWVARQLLMRRQIEDLSLSEAFA
jgi:predicted NAD/FAD-binding protein